MSISLEQIKNTLGPLIVASSGNLNAPVKGIRSLENPESGYLLFVENSKQTDHVIALKPSALIVSKKLSDKFNGLNIPMLVASNVMLAVAITQKAHFMSRVLPHPLIHSTALVSKSAELGTGVEVGAYAVVEDRVKIGDNAVIGAHV